MTHVSNPVSLIELSGHKLEKQQAREKLAAESFRVLKQTHRFQPLIDECLGQITIRSIDRHVKHRNSLTFSQAFTGMCYVLAATNAHLRDRFALYMAKANGEQLSQQKILAQGVAFLNLMATKESLTCLTPEEIAGMVAATKMDLMFTVSAPRFIETSGMGGDRGFSLFGSEEKPHKSINASTLSALVLAALERPAIKHGSYGNTSAVGSTEAIELFGAKTTMTSMKEITSIMDASGFCFFDAHLCKTVHDASHLLMMETINHVVGPMTPPISHTTEINRLMGVNEKIHPETVARAYAELHKRGIQKVGGVLVICGLEGQPYNPYARGDAKNFDLVRRLTVVDEVSPFGTVVAATYGDEYLGTTVVYSEDFGVELFPADILVSNSLEAIQRANNETLDGKHPKLAKYLAMNAALALYADLHLHDHATKKANSGADFALDQDRLRSSYKLAFEAIMDGHVRSQLDSYVQASLGCTPEVTAGV